jgi:outer membrane protein assembly factor BamB
VYALRADSGEVVWRMHAGLSRENIVAYGQVESPWPVPGSILVRGEVAYFVAGRQAFADGGVLVFAVDPMTGAKKWVQRIDTLPQKGYYENSGLEFDAIDCLHGEGEDVAMSRWIFSTDGEGVSVDKWAGFAKLSTGEKEVWVPRGTWSYGARHVHRFAGEAPRRPLVVFREASVYGYRNGTTEVFRRDFDLAGGEEFSGQWITGWEASKTNRAGGKPYRTWRIAEKASWVEDYFTPEEERAKEVKIGTQLHNDIHALALAGNERLYAVHKDGRLVVVSTADGSVLGEMQVPTPAWDGLAVAGGKLFLTTQLGEVLCLGEK